jgi:hypothetical protein
VRQPDELIQQRLRTVVQKGIASLEGADVEVRAHDGYF